jgi:uncharacterized membrane protein
MQNRGVTRPMAEDLPKDNMLKAHHANTLWIYWTLVLLGGWTLLSPISFGYLNEELWVNPSGGRGVWWSDETHTLLRAELMTASDIISGLLLMIFGWRSLKPNRPVSLWLCCFVGVWLTFAPILFWSPLSSAYYNDTLVGAIVIALTILIPGMPNMMKYMEMGDDTPRGWSYNPSSWPQRWIMIVLAFLGWVVSRYLTTFQLGYTDYVWDPFFGFESSTQKVLNSSMSHSLPISDAGLGTISYTFEFLMGWMGSSARWRTMPWMVTMFGLLVIPLGLVHIFLVISQPVIVGYWCAFCLLAALIMLPMIPLEFDEVFAMFQHMKEAKSRGDRSGSFWQIFWKGGSAEGTTPDKRSPKMIAFPDQPGAVVKSSLWGFSIPWTLSLSTILGFTVMFFPLIFDTPRGLSNILHVAGALVITVSTISMGELIRIGRYLNLPLAIAIAIGPFFYENGSLMLKSTGLITGILILLLAIPKGIIKDNFGPWNKIIK